VQRRDSGLAGDERHIGIGQLGDVHTPEQRLDVGGVTLVFRGSTGGGHDGHVDRLDRRRIEAHRRLGEGGTAIGVHAYDQIGGAFLIRRELSAAVLDRITAQAIDGLLAEERLVPQILVVGAYPQPGQGLWIEARYPSTDDEGVGVARSMSLRHGQLRSEVTWARRSDRG
jgi:hypothetical protein